MAIRCKRIIDGKTYNTETATRIEGFDRSHGPDEYGEHLYQTRFGAFFIYKYYEDMGEDSYEKIEPATSDQARYWLEKNYSYLPNLIEKFFGEMPEAGSGEIKYTLRIPESLRDRLSSLAKANEQSLNAWIIRCLETCASSRSNASPHFSNREA
jgi:predicted HicB family RNase H-like nuclease